MTDYKEEQINEIEALESIYPDELSVLATEPVHVFQVTVSAEEEEESAENEEEEKGQLSVILKFTYTPTYPEEAPIFEVTFDDDEDLTQEFEEQIRELVQAQIEENLGMAMIFAIVSASQEFLNEKIDDIKAAKEDKKRRIEEEKQRVEEEAANKLKGTLVTIESFLAWKEMFDQEQKELKAKRHCASESSGGKLTGKELFFQNANLDTSDMDLLDESDRVEVDESLFQDLDLELDINLDDED